MKYMTTKEISQKWGISERRIRVLCKEGRIEGAKKKGGIWSIPATSTKPLDARLKNTNNYFGLEFDFAKIDSLKETIDQYRPISKETAKSLREKLIVEWTYNTNAIEGNTLSMSETKVVLEGITIGGKTVVEHLEVINHRDAIEFVENLIKDDKALTETNIRSIHTLILKEINNKYAGKYRNENVVMSGAKHIPPKHFELNVLMKKLINEYKNEWGTYHPIIKAALLHGEFVKIHPFIDGNGRTARLLLNFELMKNGYPPIIIKNSSRAKYYEVLDYAHTTMDYKPFINLVADLVEKSCTLWLSVLR